MTTDRIENDVVAIIRSGEDAQEAVTDLERHGYPGDSVRVFHSGAGTEEELDPAGHHSGVLAKIAKSIQGALSDENKLLEEYTDAARGGAEVVAVHVDSEDQIQEVRDILLGHNGENIRHFGSFAVTDLQDQGRATG